MPGETIYSYALTTLQRVKDRIGITNTNFDTLLTRLINAMTDHIESQCGGRRFAKQTITNELYSIYQDKQEYLVLKQAPVITVTSFQYSVSIPPTSGKTWQNFLGSQYELIEDGKSGIIRIYNGIYRGTNIIRVTYDAGYLIDWANFGSNTHSLPADLTDLCERMVVKIFKRRESEGKEREGLNQSVIIWTDKMSAEDEDTINRYRRVPIFV